MTRREHKKWIKLVLDDARADKINPEETLRLAMRELVSTSLFYLLVYILKRKDADRDWVFNRCQEVQKNPMDILISGPGNITNRQS